MTTLLRNEVNFGLPGLSLDWVEKGPNDYRWSLQRNGVEIGYARLTRFYTPERRFERVFLDSLHILESYQGQGLGTALMQELCRAYGCVEMKLCAVTSREKFPRLRRFYERFGFEAYREGRKFAYMRRKGDKNK
jgi:predicted N-acetyltransferase YhbS